MVKYHVNPETGSAGKCKAETSCPFGSLVDDHYDTMAQARKAFEEKNSTFGIADREATVKLLAERTARPENIDYNYIGHAFEYIEQWEQPWTKIEEDNFDKVVKLNTILEKEPFTERDLKRAEAIIASLTPAKVYPRQPGGWSSSDTTWRARDKSIIGLAKNLLTRRRGDGLTYAPVDEVTNDRLMGLAAAQEAGLKEFNYHGFKGTSSERPPYAGEVEPYLQESIARVVRGDAIPEFATSQEDRTLLPLKDRLHFSLTPDSPAYNQQLYLSTVFPVRELKEEMELAGVDNVTVSVLTNGRENGNIYSVLEPNGTVRAFAVYEHRNSDSIIINGKSGWDGEGLPYAGDSKNNFYAEISAGDNRRAAKTLTYLMKEAQHGRLGSDDELNASAPRLDWNNILGEQIPGFRDWLKDQGVETKKPHEETEDDVIRRLDF